MPATTYAAWPTPHDNVTSVTTDDQLETETAIHALFAPHRHPKLNHAPSPEPLRNPWIDTPHTTTTPLPLPLLQRKQHVAFLAKMLDPLPGSYVSFESNRSWVLYWVLHSYDLLSTVLDPARRASAIATLLSFQNKATGGFGGGPNQISHLMSTYAAISALAIVGGPGPAPTPEHVAHGKSTEVGHGGWDDIDRAAMYQWMLSLKQPDGSFLVHTNGEVDVRASYCVICIASLLDICTPQLVRGMGDFIASCQTYEGGLAASSHPSYFHSSHPAPVLHDPLAFRPTLGEAHGGYTFCALATHLSLSLLPDCGPGPTVPGAPSTATSTSPAGSLNVPLLVRWATSQQGLPIEGAGFRGRTNKLVDGCYSWFNGGGLFSVLAPLVDQPAQPAHPAATATSSDTSSSSDWTDDTDADDDALFDRLGLQEYILIAAQPESGGGLRDKPGKRPDAYHTCYNLCGLSLAQHVLRRSDDTRAALEKAYTGPEGWSKQCYLAALGWTVKMEQMQVLGSHDAQAKLANTVNPTHPVFGITFPRAKAMMDWAYAAPSCAPAN